MYEFTLEQPATLAEASRLAGSGAKVLAGGQTLLAAMKQRLAAPDTLADLSGISSLSGIRIEGNDLVIGAMTRHIDVASSTEVKATLPALADLAAHIGDRQVRAMGTLGGSVANNDPAACYPSALLALGATVVTTQRSISAEDFFLGMFATALKEDELITAVRFPECRRAAYIKFSQPASRFALVGVFVAQTKGGVRVAVTGAANGVFRHAGLEAALNKNFTAASAAGVTIESTELNADIHASAAYRGHLIGLLTQKAVTQILTLASVA